jgi:hypothetical protein
MSIVDVLGQHSQLEFIFAHNLSDVLHDELSILNSNFRSNSPTFLVRHETLETCHTTMFLNLVVGAPVTDRTQSRIAFGVSHPVDTIVATSRGSVVVSTVTSLSFKVG